MRQIVSVKTLLTYLDVRVYFTQPSRSGKPAWKPNQICDYFHSLYHAYPTGSFILEGTDDVNLRVLDGHQRIKSLQVYMNDLDPEKILFINVREGTFTLGSLDLELDPKYLRVSQTLDTEKFLRQIKILKDNTLDAYEFAFFEKDYYTAANKLIRMSVHWDEFWHNLSSKDFYELVVRIHR